MSQWHRENPELAGTWADPWMQHESYRVAFGLVRVAESSELTSHETSHEEPDTAC